MTTDFFALVVTGWRLVAFLSLQGLVAGWLIRRLTRHSVALWVQRDEPERGVRLRLAIQSNESVPLRGSLALLVRLDAPTARFLEDPVVFAGCKAFRASGGAPGNEWRLSFDELPPHDSWMIECYATTLTDVTFSLSGGDSSPSHRSVRLVGTESSALVGTEVSPDPLLAALVLLASEAAYFLWALAVERQPLNWADGLVGSGLALFGLVAFLLIARKPHPVMQGYWKPTAVTRDEPVAESLVGV